MIWLMAFIGVFIAIVSVLSCNEEPNDKSVAAMSRVILRFFASVLFILGLLVAFADVDLQHSKYWGFVRVEHNLLSAIVLEISSVVLALLSLNFKRCSTHS